MVNGDKAVSLLLTSGWLLAVKLTKTATDYARPLTVIALYSHILSFSLTQTS